MRCSRPCARVILRCEGCYRTEPFDKLRARPFDRTSASGSAEQFGPELTAEGLTVEASVEPLRARAEGCSLRSGV